MPTSTLASAAASAAAAAPAADTSFSARLLGSAPAAVPSRPLLRAAPATSPQLPPAHVRAPPMLQPNLAFADAATAGMFCARLKPAHLLWRHAQLGHFRQVRDVGLRGRRRGVVRLTRACPLVVASCCSAGTEARAAEGQERPLRRASHDALHRAGGLLHCKP